MQIGLIVPEDTPPTGGNNISAERLKQSLLRRNVQASTMLYGTRLPAFDVYHAFNARRTAMRLVSRGVNPEHVIATWTGTDLWQDWVQDYRPLKQGLDPVRFQVVFTEDGRDRLLADAPDWADRVVVVPPAVDEELFHPAPRSPLAWSQPTVLLAGGIRPVKRSAWSIDLVSRVREQLGVDLHLAIVGPVRHLGEWMEVERRAHGKPWVHLVGEVSKQAMPDWYNAVDFVLNTSAVEGVSNALMEAMACGAMVVCSDIAGNRYLVEDGVTGVLFGDVDSFVERMDWVLTHGEQVEAIKRKARARIVSRHSLDAEATQYLKLYQECLMMSPGGCQR